MIDDSRAKKAGRWSSGDGLAGYIGKGYLFSSSGSITFSFTAPGAGDYDIRLGYRHHENRGNKVPVRVEVASGNHPRSINMRKPGPLPFEFLSLGIFPLIKGETASVVIGTAGADAIQAVPIK